MPEFPAKPEQNGQRQPALDDDIARKFLAEDNDFRRRAVFVDSKECMRCHPPRNQKLDFTPLDFGRFNDPKGGKVNDADLLKAFARAKAPETDEQRQARELEQFNKFKPHEKAISVFSRLPEKAKIEIGKENLSIQTDFAKALEAIPGIKLDPTARDVLGSIKSLSLSGDRFQAQFAAEKKLALGMDVPLIGTLKELRLSDKEGKLNFDVDLDSKDAKHVGLKNISGLSIVKEDGKEIGVRAIKLDISGSAPKLNVTIDNPGTKPERLPEALWPKTISVPIPLDKIAPGLSPDFVGGLIKTAADLRGVLKNRDFSGFLGAITEDGLRNTVEKLLNGVSKIEKNGNEVTIMRDNGMLNHDLGGPTLKISSMLKFRLGSDPAAPSIRDISGIFVEVPVPAELKLGDKMLTSIRSVDLGYAGAGGNRDITITTDSPLERINVRLNSEMQAVKDGAGNWNVNVRVPNILSDNARDKLNLSLRMGSNGNLNMKTSEILDIVSRASGQAADLSFSGAGNAVICVGTRVISGIADFFGW